MKSKTLYLTFVIPSFMTQRWMVLLLASIPQLMTNSAWSNKLL
jgi:hypothetical protein